MTKRKASSKRPNTPPSLDSAQAAELLRTHCDKGRQLLNNRPISSAANNTWETVVQDILIRAFGSSSPNIERVMSVGRYEFAFGGGSEPEREEARARNMTTRLEILSGLIELLDSLEPNRASPVQREIGNSVFLVHGHNEAIMHETARLLETLGLKVTILREQPNSGRTIIEKFVDHSDGELIVIMYFKRLDELVVFNDRWGR